MALNFPEIPVDRIAQTPLARRDQSRLMVLNRLDGKIGHQEFGDLPPYFSSGDVLVLNDVRVSKARLTGRKPSGGRVSVLLLARFPDAPKERWSALVTPRPTVGSEFHLVSSGGESGDGPRATVVGALPDGEWDIVFSESIDDFQARFGQVPLPPYIKRPLGPTEEDHQAYPTAFGTQGETHGPAIDGRIPRGAVAAPTAGRHFTPELLARITAGGVEVRFVTLWVGWGTFRPLASGDYQKHRMLPEPYRIPSETAAALSRAKTEGRRIWAVGTTVTRALESAADSSGVVKAGDGVASLFITPGYNFRVVDRLITNFHSPHHTPLLLTAAFAGPDFLRRAYATALAEHYRFFSYGDAMVIL